VAEYSIRYPLSAIHFPPPAIRNPLSTLPWFPNRVWEPSSRNSVSRLPSHAIERGAKRSFTDGVPKQSLKVSHNIDYPACKKNGTSAEVVAATRPAAPIIALTRDPCVYRRMNLLWGVIPRLIDTSEFERP
jgi:hypothetical protein